MGLPCSKRIITLIWCLMECLFFSGILNGWPWMQTLLKEDRFFIEHCNLSHLTINLNHHLNTTFRMPTKENPKRSKTPDGQTIECYYKKVLKIIPIADLKDFTEAPPETDMLPPQIIPIDVALSALSSINASDIICDEQDSHLELVISLVIIIRNLLMFPLGIFLDKYGTSRTRLIAMTCTVLGSLTMLFTGTAYPWLVFPAMLMLGVSGLLVLLTDLQIANMFGERRYTVMSMFVGAYFSGGIVIFFMKLTSETGISVQTSFMFITVGILPVLISTIAMLPRSRIPWPLPPSYGKSKNFDSDDSKAWQRRISVGGKKRLDIVTFTTTLRDPLYITLVVWICLLSLKSFVIDLTLNYHLQRISPEDGRSYTSVCCSILLFSLLVSPFIGIIMDCKRAAGREPHIQQMHNILVAIALTLTFSVCGSATLLLPVMDAQIIAFVFITLEKVSLYATFFAFLMHVHFPSEHFGKSVGLAMGLSGVFYTLHYPLSMLTESEFHGNTFYTHLILLCLLLLAVCHPLCVWYMCRLSAIKNLTSFPEPQKSVTLTLMENQGASEETGPTESGSRVGLQVTDL